MKLQTLLNFTQNSGNFFLFGNPKSEAISSQTYPKSDKNEENSKSKYIINQELVNMSFLKSHFYDLYPEYIIALFQKGTLELQQARVNYFYSNSISRIAYDGSTSVHKRPQTALEPNQTTTFHPSLPLH